MIFSYQAKDEAGRTVTGSLDARDERSAASEIRAMGYFPMRLAPLPAAAGPRREAPASGEAEIALAAPSQGPIQWLLARLIYPLWSGVSLRDLALFYRQFSALMHAGVPIYQSLTTLMAQSTNSTLRRCLGTISAQVEQGDNLSSALGRYPWIFLDFHRAMTEAGEKTGRLDLMFSRLASALELEYALRANIKREMFYPTMVLVASFLLPPIVLLVVKNDVPAYLRAAIYPLLEFGGVIVVVYILTRLASQLKLAYDAVASCLPPIGGAVRMIALARFCRAMASLYAAGLDMPESLRYASAACGNAFLAAKMLRAIPALQSGQGMAASLAATGAFPPLVVTMLHTGEQTGSLDQTLDKAAEYYEQESAVKLHQLSVSLGALMTIFVGIKIAGIALGFYGGQGSEIKSILNDMDK